MNNLQQTENLLKQVQVKIQHSKEISALKGENFNLFSILNMETSENNTHSRFLAELLNPRGKHELKNEFLKSFIDVVFEPYLKDNIIMQRFDTASAKVFLEKYIGRRDDDHKIGGRVDIVITDKNGYSILIENKINALDQNAQIERYCNYNTTKCVVIYLTLQGKEPEISSKGQLVNGNDFFCLSYKNDIITWLGYCLKEAADKPILRESIKQYIILLKKITGQLTNNKMSEDVKKLILNNLESAGAISNNFNEAIEDILKKIRYRLRDRLRNDERLSDYTIRDLGKIQDKNSKLWFYHKDINDDFGVYFGIEPFSGKGNRRNQLFIGIIDIESRHEDLFREYAPELEVIYWWRDVEDLLYEDSKIYFSNLKLLQRLGSSDEELNRFIEVLTLQTISYIKRNEDFLFKIYNMSKSTLI